VCGILKKKTEVIIVGFLVAACCGGWSVSGKSTSDVESIFNRNNRRLVQEVSRERLRHGKRQLRTHVDLQRLAARSFSKEINRLHRDPDKQRKGPLATRAEVLAPPGAASGMSMSFIGQTLDEVGEKLRASKLSKDADLTHIGLVVDEVELEGYNPFWLVCIVASGILPVWDVDAYNKGMNNFFVNCPFCGKEYQYDLLGLQQDDCGFSLSCKKCRMDFDCVRLDIDGDFHRPTWFMRGFRPHRVREPIDAWTKVRERCQYVTDQEEFNREDVWQTARQTWIRRIGDCEDVSILLADWLADCGFQARVVLGTWNEGHAWVVLHEDGHDYILEATGDRRPSRRIPPRAAYLTDYKPKIQFDRHNMWFRRSRGWTGEYFNNPEWKRQRVLR